MKNTYTVCALAGLVAAACCAENARKEDPRDRYTTEGWKLSWSEEFNGTGAPDRAVWQPEVGFIRNHEPQLREKKGPDGKVLKDEKGKNVMEPTGKIIPAAKFPMEMKVDYVRYYEKEMK